ncbi:O-methyltransferase [Ructibacterium gallinarum]|uniref:tRNA 5-hydroxyuridine methyltransferase n=1 Tax=Ructibacterium gallinarum TaxID=2779355 RepID=A0A9D5LZN7_9FIRM|nr:O-methyltransferase [Ructibacterium gallinarum]MBE5039922.1 O-methyltransferase [Ructibacterium gallinarum]
MIDDNINHEYIIRYLRDLLPVRSGLPREMELYAAEHDVPISQPETMKLLEVLIALGKIQTVLEVGTAIGYSAICMAQAGCNHVDTIEISPEAAKIARENFERAGLSKRIHLYEGDAKQVLARMRGSYDMIFIDAAKAQYHEFFPHCMRMLKIGGLLVSDNVLYKGMTATDELLQHRKITIVRRLRRYLDMLSSLPYLQTSVLPVGDGVALSVKCAEEPHENLS